MLLSRRRRGKKDYEPPRYMTVSQAAEQLLEVEENRKEGGALGRVLSGPGTAIVAGLQTLVAV